MNSSFTKSLIADLVEEGRREAEEFESLQTTDPRQQRHPPPEDQEHQGQRLWHIRMRIRRLL